VSTCFTSVAVCVAVSEIGRQLIYVQEYFTMTNYEEELTRFKNEINRLTTEDLPSGIEPLAELLTELELAFIEIQDKRRSLRQELSVRLADSGLSSFDFENGIRIERSTRTSRKNLDREGLINYIMDDCSRKLIDVETGEKVIEVDQEKLSGILLTCFRAEPKWKALSEHGVSDEEFCDKETFPTVKFYGLKD